MRNKRNLSITENWLDRAINALAPRLGVERRRAKMQLAVSNSFVGADSDKRHMRHYSPTSKSADAEIMPSRNKLVARSQDLYKNTALARGAINTKVSNVVGSGLTLQPAIDAEALGMTEEQANAWKKQVKREFYAWAESKDCDITRTNNFYELQALADRTTLIDGDVICLLPMVPVASLAYETRIQLIDSARLCNKDGKSDTDRMVGGVVMDDYGAPTAYSIAKFHPVDYARKGKNEWSVIPAFGKSTGRRNVLHLFKRERIGQTRGLPDLTPVIEPLKQLADYTEYELEAAAVSAIFAVFVKTESGDGLNLSEIAGEAAAPQKATSDTKLSGGLMVDLLPGEDVTTASPNRPNVNYDPFVLSILRQIGVALELPFEILIKHFTASYSAARAAMLEAWRYFSARREWLAFNFCQPIYEAWMWEAVAKGRIQAPGFLTDPGLRAAYLNANWTGPARGQIDELKEAKAAREWLDMGVKTLDQVTQEETGLDWEANQRQRAKEISLRRELDIEMPEPPVGAPTDPSAIDSQENADNAN